MKCSDYIIKFFTDRGVTDAFMISGGGAMHLVDSVGTNPALRYTCPHHEQSAAIAAEGYYRATGKMAMAVVTSGPGGTNTITGVIGQWLDSIPCVYLSGQVKTETTIWKCPDLKLRQLGDQEINIADIVRPVTKYSVMVTDAKKIRYHLEKAYHLATTGRPGPVWIDVPLDIQSANIDPAQLESYAPAEDAVAYDQLDPALIEGIIKRIKEAKRPVILAGHGIRLAGAAGQFLKLVEQLGVPVLTAICGHDLIPSDHPLFFGRPGICGDRWGNMVVQNSDLFIAIGARMGIRQISYNYAGFAPHAYKIMVDIDAAELNKPTFKADQKIHADAKDFINVLLSHPGSTVLPQKREWTDWCQKVKKALPTILEDNSKNPNYVNSYVFAKVLFDAVSPDTTVVTGNGTAYTGTFQIMDIKKGVRVFTNQGCASMGYDIPAALGAAIGQSGKPVICITGDGSIQMNLQELQTIVAHQLPIKIFVINNDGYLAIRATQDAYFEGRHIASCPERNDVTCPDICKLADAYGMANSRIQTEEGLKTKIEQILAKPGPYLCEIMMDPKQTLLPKLSSMVMPDGSMVSKPLEDMFPFIDRKLFDELMLVGKN